MGYNNIKICFFRVTLIEARCLLHSQFSSFSSEGVTQRPQSALLPAAETSPSQALSPFSNWSDTLPEKVVVVVVVAVVSHRFFLN